MSDAPQALATNASPNGRYATAKSIDRSALVGRTRPSSPTIRRNSRTPSVRSCFYSREFFTPSP